MRLHSRGALTHAQPLAVLGKAEPAGNPQADQLTIAFAQRLQGGADGAEIEALLDVLLDAVREFAVAPDASDQRLPAPLAAVLVDHGVACDPEQPGADAGSVGTSAPIRREGRGEHITGDG